MTVLRPSSETDGNDAAPRIIPGLSLRDRALLRRIYEGGSDSICHDLLLRDKDTLWSRLNALLSNLCGRSLCDRWILQR